MRFVENNNYLISLLVPIGLRL